jgi:hypothetical protein
LRNHGLSVDSNGRSIPFDNFESRDVAGSIEHAKTHLDTKDMDEVLFSICLGANSTLVAMEKSLMTSGL